MNSGGFGRADFCATVSFARCRQTIITRILNAAREEHSTVAGRRGIRISRS